MYHFIVKQIVRRGFQNVSQGNYEALLAQFHPNLEHRFAGNHALGGERHTVDTMRRWFHRLGRIFPELRFELKQIAVQGWPWNTLVAVEWDDWIEQKAFESGQPPYNHGVHFIRLRWGRIAAIHVHLDTQKLEVAFRHRAEQGITEALDPPITD